MFSFESMYIPRPHPESSEVAQLWPKLDWKGIDATWHNLASENRILSNFPSVQLFCSRTFWNFRCHRTFLEETIFFLSPFGILFTPKVSAAQVSSLQEFAMGFLDCLACVGVSVYHALGIAPNDRCLHPMMSALRSTSMWSHSDWNVDLNKRWKPSRQWNSGSSRSSREAGYEKQVTRSRLGEAVDKE